MAIRRISDPIAPAVPVQVVQQQLRVVNDDDLLHLTGLIYAATNAVEQHIGRALVQQGWELTLDSWPKPEGDVPSVWQDGVRDMASATGIIRLPRAPVLSVTEVRYFNSAGTSTVLASSEYQVDAASSPARLAPAYGKVWPAVQPRLAAITITYLAGYGTSWNDVPEDIRLAIMMMVAHFYENREAVIVGASPSELMLGFEWLLMPYTRGLHA